MSICEEYIKYASLQKVELIIFPEMSLSGYVMESEDISEEQTSSASLFFFSSLAKYYHIAIIFGMVLKDKNSPLAQNCAIFMDNKGEIKAKYIKIHPFTLAHEEQFYQQGNTLSIIEYKNHRIALTICYDLRFAQLYSILEKSSDIIVNIASWPTKRVTHWESLLKARAIENQLYIIGVNRSGIDGNGLEYCESSHIFNANGEDLISLGKYKDLKIFIVEKEKTTSFKSSFNTTKDKKWELYKNFLS